MENLVWNTLSSYYSEGGRYYKRSKEKILRIGAKRMSHLWLFRKMFYDKCVQSRHLTMIWTMSTRPEPSYNPVLCSTKENGITGNITLSENNKNAHPTRTLFKIGILKDGLICQWASCFLNYSLLLNRRHVSTIRQDNFWKLSIVITWWQVNQSFWNFQCFIKLPIETSIPNSIWIDWATT